MTLHLINSFSCNFHFWNIPFRNLFYQYVSFFYHNLYPRRINRMKASDSPMSCGNESVYLHTGVKSEEASTYQELDLSIHAYHNTTIRWSINTYLLLYFLNEKHINMCIKKQTKNQNKNTKKKPSKLIWKRDSPKLT